VNDQNHEQIFAMIARLRKTGTCAHQSLSMLECKNSAGAVTNAAQPFRTHFSRELLQDGSIEVGAHYKIVASSEQPPMDFRFSFDGLRVKCGARERDFTADLTRQTGQK
jgi:hypothetical protein